MACSAPSVRCTSAGTAAAKARMWESRVGTADRIARVLSRSVVPGRVLVSAGGINVHAGGGDELVTEATALGDEWVARMLRAKENAADQARATGARVVEMRIGLALGRGGGPL